MLVDGLGENCYSSVMLIAVARPSLSLAFVNTRYWRGRAAPEETLHGLQDLCTWLGRQGLGRQGLGRQGLESEGLESEGLEREGVEREDAFTARPSVSDRGAPAPEGALFTHAIAVRETLFRLFLALAEGRAVPAADFTALQKAVRAAPGRRLLDRCGDSYGWRVEEPLAGMPELLAPILWSAADLLLAAPNRRVRRCANDECLWLFLDESRNGSRRWCDMAACGNRAKARRHYAKTHTAS